VTKELILVRHGQTLHNVAGIAQGWGDSELSELGRSQVLRLAERIARMQPTALYASPLGRARATAQAIADVTSLPIIELEDLREMNYGGWEGRSFLDVRREDEALYQRWITDGEACSPSGESHGDVRRRLERVVASVESDRPVLVSHGTAIRIAATALLNVPLMTAHHFAQDNAALNIFVWRANRWVMKVWNDATHCSGV
jgi:broad specificity phosphatase PhoE